MPRAFVAIVGLPLCFAQSPTTTPQQHDSIVVTGTYEPVPLQESDRDVIVLPVNAQRLLFGSIADVLKLDSSIDLRQRAPNNIQSDLAIRGGSFGETLVLLNGIRLNDAQSGHHDMDLPVPFDAITEMQVLRGSGSSQYGADAMDGVLNIITRNPEAPELRLRSSVGNFGTNSEGGSLAFRAIGLDQQFAFTRDFSSGFMPDRDYRNLALASITHATSRLGATDVVLSNSDRAFGADQFYGNFDSWERTRGWFASARQELGRETEADFAYRRHTDLFVLFREDPAYFTNRHIDESWDGALRRNQDLPHSASLHYGAEVFSDSINSNNLGIHSRIYEAAYAAFDIRVLHRFSLTASAREDIYGSFNREFSPTLSGGVWLTSKLKLHASASHAFRLPTYTDLYYHDPANLGSPTLRPEHATEFEAGGDYYSTPNLRLAFTVFRRSDRDLIDYVRASDNDIYRATNLEHIVFTGFEGRLAIARFHRGSIEIQYTGIHAERLDASPVQSRYVFNFPVQSGLISWQGAIGPWLVARTRIGIVERYASDAYGVWDASVARSSGVIRPFLQLTNITSTVYQEILGVVMPKLGIVGGIQMQLPMPKSFR